MKPQLATNVIPEQMMEAAQWVVYRSEQRDNGKFDKIPVNPHNGINARVNDPKTWATHDDARAALKTYSLAGVGFVLTEETGIVGIDLDGVRDPQTGALEPLAERIIKLFDSYTEISPSGKGVHIFCRGTLPNGKTRSGAIEMYAKNRYFTVTGSRLDSVSTELEERQDAIETLHAWITEDEDLVSDALRDESFAALWDGDISAYNDDHSAADQALCNMLAPRCRYDAERMDRIFRLSGLMRDKWTERHSADGRSYGEMTIEKALEQRPEMDEFSTTQREVRAWSAEEFLERKFDAKEPLIDGLLHKRDMVALAGRRREGKTTLGLNIGVALALPAPDFLGYPIPQARRSLLLLLEDDAGEVQEKLRRITRGQLAGGRLRIVTRDDFYDAGMQVDIRRPEFKAAMSHWAHEHQPELIVIDNLAHVIAAEYNDSKRVHELMTFCYRLAKEHNCAIILCAHPKKDNPDNPADLEHNSVGFFESVMGSSHFVNSTGSLWGIQRQPLADSTIFVGGRQRADGHQGATHLELDDEGWFRVVSDHERNLPLVTGTPARRAAWERLPDPPKAFGYSEGERLVQPVMRSSSTYSKWMKECRRLRVVLELPDGKLRKAGGVKTVEFGEVKQAA